MQPAYVALLVLAGASFLLQVQWLFFLSLLLFVVLLFAEAYGSANRQPAAIAEAEPSAVPAQVSQQQPQQPIVVVTGGGGLNPSENYLTTLLATYSAMDAYQKEGQASPYKFLSRGSVMRQNFFGEKGEVPKGQTHQGMKRDYSDRQMKDLMKKMDALIDKMGK